MKTIDLYSRYGERNYLESFDTKGDSYVLKVETDKISMGYTKDNDLFVDPVGGPMIIENHKLLEANRVVESIKHVKNVGFVITFK